MHCPSCNGTIKYFSRFNFKLGNVKACPHCNVQIKHSVNFIYCAIGFFPSIFFQLKILGPFLFSLGVPYAYPVAQGITIMVFLRIIHEFKFADKPEKTNPSVSK